jgi:broad specificity phosphatase PhoE
MGTGVGERREGTIVTIVQHAEKDRGPGDPGLTLTGRGQAERIAARLEKLRIDSFLCSPMLRARETATPLARALGRQPELDERLIERANWDGAVTLAEFLADWDRTTTDRDFRPRNGESSRAAGDRFARVVRELACVAGSHAVLVTHGGVTIDGLRTLVGDRELQRVMPAWRRGIPPAALTRLQLDGIGLTSWRWLTRRTCSTDGPSAGASLRPSSEAAAGAGSENRSWLRLRDSNPVLTAPKAVVLPLHQGGPLRGAVPVCQTAARVFLFRRSAARSSGRHPVR